MGLRGSDVQELHQRTGGASTIPLPAPLVTQTCSYKKRKGCWSMRMKHSHDCIFHFISPVTFDMSNTVRGLEDTWRWFDLQHCNNHRRFEFSSFAFYWSTCDGHGGETGPDILNQIQVPASSGSQPTRDVGLGGDLRPRPARKPKIKAKRTVKYWLFKKRSRLWNYGNDNNNNNSVYLRRATSAEQPQQLFPVDT